MTVIRPNSVSGINSITVQSGNSLAVHKANGELIRTIAGTTGVSTFSSISVGTAYTDNSAGKSINIGLGASIAQHNDNSLTFGTAGDPRITIDASGNFNVGSAATIKAGGNATFSGIVTAASFVGDGSGLTGAGPSLTGSTNNTIVTVTGANAIAGETNLTFDGTRLNVGGTGVSQTRTVNIGSDSEANLAIETHNTSASETANIRFYRSRGTAASPTTLVDNDVISNLLFYGHDGTDYANAAGMIRVECDGTVAGNQMPGNISFHTNAGGTSATERLRIASTGAIAINGNRAQAAPTEYNDITGTNQAGLLIGSSGITDAGIVLRTSASGTGRIYFGDNSGSESARKAGAIEYGHSSNAMLFYTDSTERLRITSTGRIGIGTDDPDHKFEVMDAGSSVATSRSGNNAQLLFKSNNVGQAAQIDVSESSGGGVFIIKNKTTGGTLTESFRVNTDQTISTNGAGQMNSGILNIAKDGTHITCKSFATGGYDSIFFRSANTNVGKIHFNSGGTQYHTSSDYRRKENVVGITSAITRLKTLKPYRFNFKVDPSVTVDGFFAHEVTTVPEAILGTKDAVATAADVSAGISTYVGEPIYQTIDQSKLVPLLTAALQEAVTKIETLETKVAALEGG